MNPPLPPQDPRIEKEPLVTGHSGKEDVVEQARLNRLSRFIGPGRPLWPQAMLYLVLLTVFVLVMWLVLSSRSGWFPLPGD